ncbi:MAG: phage tail tube protein [Candidatus Omnitrophica bacterium]|nr:phage tail tube protein [Candidatus Omnitrophota bacterium]
MTVGRVAPSVRGTYLFGRETSPGTGGTANKDIGLIQNFSVAPDADITDHHGQGQSAAVGVKSGKVTPKGTYDLVYQHGRILEYAFFGGTTTHAATTGDEVHTFVWGETLPSFAWEASYEKGTTDDVQKGTGLVFGSSTISCGLDGVLKVSGDWLGKTIDNSATSATAAVVNSGLPIGGFEGALNIAESDVNFLQSWEITHNPNTKVIHGEGSRAPSDISSHDRSVSFRAKLGLEDLTQANRLLGSASAITTTEPTAVTLIFKADNGVTLGSGERSVELTVSASQLKYNVTAAKNDFVMIDLDGFGVLSAGEAVDQVLSASW